VVAGERDRPDVARRRAQWTKYQDRVEPERLVFIDETWTRTDMDPLRGWAERGGDGDSFRLYIEKVLLPTLRPGDIVIMDNLGSHKSKAVRQLIRSVGAKLFFLPKYSPDLNPIEQVFAKLKHFLRQAAARTVEAVCAVIGEILQAFTPQECANYFQNSGYSRT
jgi:transposase